MQNDWWRIITVRTDAQRGGANESTAATAAVLCRICQQLTAQRQHERRHNKQHRWIGLCMVLGATDTGSMHNTAPTHRIYNIL